MTMCFSFVGIYSTLNTLATDIVIYIVLHMYAGICQCLCQLRHQFIPPGTTGFDPGRSRGYPKAHYWLEDCNSARAVYAGRHLVRKAVVTLLHVSSHVGARSPFETIGPFHLTLGIQKPASSNAESFGLYIHLCYQHLVRHRTGLF
jgi:hypothetical protein